MGPPALTQPAAMKRLVDAAEGLKPRFGDHAVESFVRAVGAANPSVETIVKMTADAGVLLGRKPNEELIREVTGALDRLFATKMNRFLASISVNMIAAILERRNEEFLMAFANECDRLTKISPMLTMGLMSEEVLPTVVCFSIEGLRQWVREGIERFGTSSRQNTMEFLRYLSLDPGYDDTRRFRIAENAVFLDDVKGALVRFVMLKFGRMLVVGKARDSSAYAEETTLAIRLPEYRAYHDVKEDNRQGYFMTTLHEGVHITRGSFVLDVVALIGIMRERGAVLKRAEFKEDGRVKSLLIEKEGKEYLCTSMFHIIPLLTAAEHTKGVAYLWNVVEDLRDDCIWLDEMAAGYRADARRQSEDFIFTKGYREPPERLTSAGFVEGLFQVTHFLAISKTRREFLTALRTGECDALDEGDRAIVGKLRRMDGKVLEAVLKFEPELLELTTAREMHTTRSMRITLKLWDYAKTLTYEETPYRGGKSGTGSGMGGPIGLSDIDPEKVEFGVDKNSAGIDPKDLPDDVRKKLEAALKDKLVGMDPAERDKLLEGLANAPGSQDSKGNAPMVGGQVPGRWDIALVDDVEVNGYCEVHTSRLAECGSIADTRTAAEIRRIATRIITPRVVEEADDLTGEADVEARREYRRDRRFGIVRPPDFHISTTTTRARSVAMLVVADASGSTESKLNGERKIYYITRAVHTLTDGLSGLPGIRMGYGFYNSRGRTNIRFYEGQAIGEERRHAKVEPNNANRDGAIYRHAGKLLSAQQSEVKIAVFVVDSMPADSDYNEKQAVEDVRHAISELRKAGILVLVFTVAPDESYYKEQFGEGEGGRQRYLDYIYAGHEYCLLDSEKSLPDGFSRMVRSALPRLRRTELA